MVEATGNEEGKEEQRGMASFLIGIVEKVVLQAQRRGPRMGPRMRPRMETFSRGDQLVTETIRPFDEEQRIWFGFRRWIIPSTGRLVSVKGKVKGVGSKDTQRYEQRTLSPIKRRMKS